MTLTPLPYCQLQKGAITLSILPLVFAIRVIALFNEKCYDIHIKVV
nr:MAG TPA: hypothetical protein [Caudoviricetes sp.]DAU51663.1 MAG TPA: hypothetical protein [Caudoviricetes sp.]